MRKKSECLIGDPEMADEHVTRRGFVRSAAVGIGAGAVVSEAQSRKAFGSEGGDLVGAKQAAASGSGVSGRQIWVASLCQHKIDAATPKENIRKMLHRMEEVLPMQPDVICLPECFHVARMSAPKPPLAETAEKPIGAISHPFADFARRNRCNLVCPIYTEQSGRFYNAAVIIDREGQYVGEYRKINPTEGELEQGLTPGPIDPPVFKLDFGTIGVQICFDVNWHDNWTRLRQKGAEMIFWPSAFAGGEMLKGLAWINKVPIVSSTQIQPTTIVDALGDEIVSTGRFGEWVCGPVNLDFAIVQGWQMINKFDQVRRRYGRQINVKIKHEEAWGMLESLSPDVSIPQVLKEFGMETSSEMLARNTRLQDSRRPPAGKS
jgi:predicted amidohydrolase